MTGSPSSRGRGLKYITAYCRYIILSVALFTRAWIEIFMELKLISTILVALFTRAWIEIRDSAALSGVSLGRPLHEGVD